MQTKKQSFIESSLNTASGFAIAWGLALFVIPMYDSANLQSKDALEITLIYTAVSIIRSYLWRRFFTSKGQS